MPESRGRGGERPRDACAVHRNERFRKKADLRLLGWDAIWR